MARRHIRAGVKFTPDPTDTYLEPKPYLKVSLFGTKRKPQGQQPTKGPSWDGMVAKAGNQVDKAHRKLLEASGTRYEVLVRKSTRMRSAGKTASPAQAQRRAIAKGGIVHDHYEGRVIFVSPSFKERFGPKDTPPDTTDTSEDDGGTWEVSA